MSIGNIVKRKLAWRSLFLGLFLSLALASIAYAYAYTQTWQDHFTTDPLGSISDCGSSSDGPGPTAWYWFQRGGCIAHSGSTVSVYTNVDLRDGPDLYREDLGGILPTNWRIDARFNFYEKYGFGTQVTITCQGKSTCAWLAKPQIIAYAGLVGGSRNVFDIHLLDPSLGGMWGMEWSADSHVGVWHTLRVERYGTNLYLYLDNVLQHTSTNVDERYRPSAIIFGDPTVQPASGQWTRLSGDHVTIYNVTACSVPGKPALSVSPSGCTNNSTPTWSWSASDGGCAIDQYEVTRSWAANFTTTSTSYTPTLGTGSYWLGVRAHNSAGWGSWSDSVTVQVDLSGPNTPTHASPADNYCTNNNTPTLTANATSDVGCGGGVQYYIRVWNSAGAIVANSDWMGGTSYTTPALATGTYTWQILARDRFGNESAWSSARTIMIDQTAPPTPSLSSPADNSYTTDTTPTLTVNVVSDVGCNGAVLYQIVVDDDPNFGSLNADSGWQTGTSYTASPALTPGPNYYYWRARAEDGFGNTSGWSASWKFKVVRSGSIVGTVWNDTNNVGNTLLCESSPQGPAYTSSKVRVAYSCETWDPNYDSAVGTCLTETSLTNGTYSFSNVPVYEDFGGGAYTVSITPPSGGWIQTTPTCNAVVVRWQNDQRTANFGISNNPLSWIQGVNGDIYSNNGIRVQVPTKAFWGGLDTYNGYNRWFLDANPYPGTHLGGGVVISGSTDNPSCGGGTSVDGRCSRRPNGDLTEPGWRVRDEQMAWPSLNLAGLKIVPLPSIPWGALDSGKVYYTDNPLTVPNSYNLNANGVAVIYVKDANVTFAAPGFNCSLPSCNPNRMGIIFVVENGQVTIPGGTTQIDALILVIGGTIRVEGTNVANNLTVYGMLYAQNGINSARTLTDNRTPAVQVKYNPLYLLPNRLAKPQLTWREIAP